MVVYFIQRPSDGAIKIGISESLKQRMSRLGDKHKENMGIIRVIEGGRKEERMLHERFADLRFHGEWFRADQKLMDYIETLESIPIEDALRIESKKVSSLSIDTDLVTWVDSQIKIKRFSSMSHACEYALEKLRRDESEKQRGD